MVFEINYNKNFSGNFEYCQFVFYAFYVFKIFFYVPFYIFQSFFIFLKLHLKIAPNNK